MQGLGFLHLQPTFQKLVRQHDRWKALLRAEISKAESLMEKETGNKTDETIGGTSARKTKSSNMASRG